MGGSHVGTASPTGAGHTGVSGGAGHSLRMVACHGARYRAWWAHEDFGRCALAVTAPRRRPSPSPCPPLPAVVADRWLEFDYLAAANEYRLGSTFFGGEAFPKWTPGYPGWDCIPTYLGAEVTLAEETGWIAPLIASGSIVDHDFHSLVISSDSTWWRFAERMHQFAAAQARGKSIPGIQAIGGSGDTLAFLRGTNQLLLDVIDNPDYVRRFELYLMRQWLDVYDHFYDAISPAAEGSTCWFPLWAPGRFYAAQNDFSYMISPRMFEDIFLPALQLQIGQLDYVVYHVDGIGAFVHVDIICSLPGVQAVQILPGAGKPSPLHYLDVLKKVQRAGKNLHITISSDEVRPALELLSSRGLFIDTTCESEDEARDLLALAGQWSKVRAV
jgi:hypothetical protein